jgi:hypothetical protein
MLLMLPVVLDVVVSFCEAISIIQWPATIHAGCPCSSFWMLEIIPNLWFAPNWRNILIMSPPSMSIDMPGVAVSALLVCACAGAATPNIPQVIAKAATTAAAVRVVFIKQAENTTNLKDSCQNSLISFSSYHIA